MRDVITNAENGPPAWLVKVCRKWYTVDLLREWIHRADGGGWSEPRFHKHRESAGQRDRWAKALAILEGSR